MANVGQWVSVSDFFTSPGMWMATIRVRRLFRSWKDLLIGPERYLQRTVLDRTY
jgi:hypothetical protein